MEVRLIVIACFLGSGKTTAILKIAKKLTAQGKKIGIVTNDQSENLVDTAFLSSQGYGVVEVTKGCFCCNFDEFTLKLQSLSEKEMPDIILAEPVGSCTDLIATIFKPIMNNYTKSFILSPLSVLVDPSRLAKFIKAVQNNYLNEINYLFDKQLEEADIILLNKCDAISSSDIERFTDFLKDRYKGAKVLAVSSEKETGLDALISLITNMGLCDKKAYDIDYDTYASAEAALGWYNGQCTINCGHPVDINIFAASLLDSIRKKCLNKDYDIAHLKVYLISGTDFAKASVTSNENPPHFDAKAALKAKNFNVLLNARIQAPFENIESICTESLKEISSNCCSISSYKYDCFSPKYPKPEFRIS